MSGVTVGDALAVGAGAALGALARWGAGMVLNTVWPVFPLGTLFVNCLGGLLIGIAMVWFQRSPDELARLFLVTGFLGGFTTFSSFSAESLGLLQRGEAGQALLHSAAHVLGALLCTTVGYLVARALLVRA